MGKQQIQLEFVHGTHGNGIVCVGHEAPLNSALVKLICCVMKLHSGGVSSPTGLSTSGNNEWGVEFLGAGQWEHHSGHPVPWKCSAMKGPPPVQGFEEQSSPLDRVPVQSCDCSFPQLPWSQLGQQLHRELALELPRAGIPGAAGIQGAAEVQAA